MRARRRLAQPHSLMDSPSASLVNWRSGASCPNKSPLPHNIFADGLEAQCVSQQWVADIRPQSSPLNTQPQINHTRGPTGCNEHCKRTCRQRQQGAAGAICAVGCNRLHGTNFGNNRGMLQLVAVVARRYAPGRALLHCTPQRDRVRWLLVK